MSTRPLLGFSSELLIEAPVIDPAMLKAALTVQKLDDGEYVLTFSGEPTVALMPTFEAEGSYGNGAAWEALAEYILATTDGITGIELDSESDAMLARCAWEAPLRHLADAFVEAASDEHRLRQLIREARDAGAGHGDL